MTDDKNKYILSINGMSKSFGRNKVLKHISMNVKPGTIMGLMGENGAEISLLADDIGIIDHGALLEEESLAELEQKSSKHIRFTLSDTAQAARILERNFHENHFSIQDDHNLRLHNLDLPVGKIVTAFVENGLEVSEAHTCEESLEDYFKRVTGGEGIA